MFENQSAIKEKAREMLFSHYNTNLVAGLAIYGVLLATGLINAILGLGQILSIGSIIVLMVLGVGIKNVALLTYQDKNPQYIDSVSSFKNFGPNLGGQMWAELFIIIWNFLFFLPANITFVVIVISKKSELMEIPWETLDFDTFIESAEKLLSLTTPGILFLIFLFLGIIAYKLKSLSYSMVPFLLASSNKIPPMDALNISKKMTRGYIPEMFLFDLSFIGWKILSKLSFEILGILWVNPYYKISFAGLFLELKEKTLDSGACSPVDFLNEEPNP